MHDTADVLVIGSGPAGCYFARRMAEQGYRVLVIDAAKAEDLGARLQIFHTDKERFDKMGVPQPRPGDPDYRAEFAAGSYYGPYGQYMKRNDGDQNIVLAQYPFLVCSLPPFLVRLRAWAKEAGAVFQDETALEDLLYNEQGVCGALVRRGNESLRIASRLVADCSGLGAVARRKLRKPTTVADFALGPRDLMYIVLHYVRLHNPEQDAPRRAEHWPYYKSWIAQTGEPDVAIFGTGANLSFDYAEICYRRFLDAVETPAGEEIRCERGIVPYRPAPYSMVDNGFLCAGDAACMNKWIGEGICSSWVGCQVAAEVAGAAMHGGAYPTRESLWAYNVRYNTTQAADFAYIVATAVNAADCSADEMDYEFRRGIVFTDQAMTRMNREYNADMPFGEILQLVGRVAGGTLSGNISFRTLQNLLKGIRIASLLQQHYRHFPRTPAKYAAWAKRADRLWARAGSMADVTERMEARRPAPVPLATKTPEKVLQDAKR
ncbi:MAG: FAD-binding protein [Oscillospiraceae bacterium]|jgi:flavin-dependent dehydrogenase|nr:FAD-binding protein [Oscillospiraceae bacterium]